MINSQVLTMILIDGTATGIVECNIDEWLGISYKIPRNKLKEASKLKYINNTGVYILFDDDEVTGDKVAYIGDAENIYNRLDQHNRNKNFWNECIVFVSQNNSLNKAHIKYIEHELYSLGKRVNRYSIKNETIPNKSSLGTADEIKAIKFIDKIKIITSVFGYRLFDELIQKNEDLSDENENILYLNYYGELMAKAIMTDEGMVILKGSKVTDDIKPSVNESVKRFILNERNCEDIENNVFINNHLIHLPSMAGAVILGMDINGRTIWKDKNGKTLKEIQEEGF